MINPYISIGIKDSSIEAVNSAIKRININSFTDPFLIHLEVMDFKEEYNSMSVFLKDNNLQDDTPFFNNFDIDPFGLRIDFELKQDINQLDILEPMVYILGQKLSIVLKTQCIVMFKNNTIPVGLFDNGSLTQIFEEYNSDYFSNRPWKPKVNL